MPMLNGRKNDMTVSSLVLLPEGYPAFSSKKELNSRNLSPTTNAFTFKVTGDGLTSFTWPIPDQMYLEAISGFFNGQTAGDFISVSIVDVNNILNHGENFVLSTPVAKYYINPIENALMKMETLYPVFMLMGLYIKIDYTSTNLLANVNCFINIIADKVFP